MPLFYLVSQIEGALGTTFTSISELLAFSCKTVAVYGIENGCRRD